MHRTVALPSNRTMGSPTTDGQGHVTGIQAAVVDVLADLDGASPTRGYYDLDVLDSGRVAPETIPTAPTEEIIVQQIDGTGSTVIVDAVTSLQSAGFVMLDLGTSETGKPLGTFAVPIYKPIIT